MAGLVPAIYAATWLAGFKSSNYLVVSGAFFVLKPALRITAWMAGTSPAMTETLRF